MEIEFTADNPGTWRLHAHPNPWDAGMMPKGASPVPLAEALVRYKGSPAAVSPGDAQAPQQAETLDLLAYGKPAPDLGLTTDTRFDRTYQLKVDMTMSMSGRRAAHRAAAGMAA